MAGEFSKPVHKGAYYVHSAPPSKKSFRHIGGGGGGGGYGCNPFICCCSCIGNCICACLCQILCAVLVIGGIALGILWFVFRPNIVKFYVTDASLAEFSIENNTLRYDLVANLTIRNPNRRIGIYYERIEARAYYEGKEFGVDQLQAFYQDHKTTSRARAEFKGESPVVLTGKEMAKYSEEESSGAFGIGVKLYLRTRFRFWLVKFMRLKPKIWCDLKVPSKSAAAAAANYQMTQCSFAWR